MKIRTRGLPVAVLLLLLGPGLANSQDEPRSYTEGPVVEVSYIKVMPGMFDAYMKWLATERKQLMAEYKRAGLILDHKVFGAQPRSPSEPDLILTVTYKNFAALDGLRDKQEPLEKKIWGSVSKANQANIDRGKMREVLGSETLQELIPK